MTTGGSRAEDRLGRYRLLQLLGRGGMGEVYLGMVVGAAGFEKPVALKVLPAQFNENPERTRRLLREAFIGVRLDTEHVVQVLDLGEHEGKYFIAMEYVRGFNLAQLIAHAASQGEQLPIWAVIRIVRAMATALDYVHKVRDPGGKIRGLVHGDVSPGNILLCIDGRIKLSDFGVSALCAEESRPVMGKPGYLPPEAFERGRVTQGWDLYALGVVLYEALSGRRAFPGMNTQEVASAVQRGVEPLATLRPECPPELVEVVTQAMHPDPARRFATAGLFRTALDRAWARDLDDGERFRDYIEQTYGRRTFVSQHGLLPTTSDLEATIRMDVGFEHWSSDTHSELAALRFGLSPALGPTIARAHGERLAVRLERVLARPVRCLVVADYRSLIELLAEGEMDFAWMPPMAFVEAQDRGASALAVARRHGRTAYESAIIVRDDSPLEGLADLRGQSMAWVDRDSAGGYLFAAAEIVRKLGPLGEVLGRQHFHGSHQAVCEAVLQGWAAAGATYVIRSGQGKLEYSGWLDLVGGRAAELRPIAFSSVIPGDNIALRPGLPPTTAKGLLAALAALGHDEEGQLILRDVFNADELCPAEPELYDQVRAVREVTRAT